MPPYYTEYAHDAEGYSRAQHRYPPSDKTRAPRTGGPDQQRRGGGNNRPYDQRGMMYPAPEMPPYHHAYPHYYHYPPHAATHPYGEAPWGANDRKQGYPQ